MFKLTIKFNYEFFQSIRGYLHLVTLILGLIVVAVGWNSHYSSEWTSLYPELKSLLNGTTLHFTDNGDNIADIRHETLHLPDLLKEKIFLGFSLASFCTSFLFYAIYLLSLQDRHQSGETLWSILYHLSGAAAIIISGGLLLLSAVEIDKFSKHLWRIPSPSEIEDKNIQLYSQKISAGVISVINGVIFSVIAALSRHEATPRKKKVRLYRKHTEDIDASSQ